MSIYQHKSDLVENGDWASYLCIAVFVPPSPKQSFEDFVKRIKKDGGVQSAYEPFKPWPGGPNTWENRWGWQEGKDAATNPSRYHVTQPQAEAEQVTRAAQAVELNKRVDCKPLPPSATEQNWEAIMDIVPLYDPAHDDPGFYTPTSFEEVAAKIEKNPKQFVTKMNWWSHSIVSEREIREDRLQQQLIELTAEKEQWQKDRRAGNQAYKNLEGTNSVLSQGLLNWKNEALRQNEQINNLKADNTQMRQCLDGYRVLEETNSRLLANAHKATTQYKAEITRLSTPVSRESVIALKEQNKLLQEQLFRTQRLLDERTVEVHQRITENKTMGRLLHSRDDLLRTQASALLAAQEELKAAKETIAVLME